MSAGGPARRPRPPLGARALLLTLLVFAATTGLALAHANLVRSDPPAGASLARAPSRVQLWFTEDVEPAFSEIVVYDVNQQRVDRGDSHVDPNDPRSMIVSLKPNLPRGTYAIAWKTQSRVDGHIVRGIVPFGVGVASVPTSPAASAGVVSGAVSGSPLEMTLRWLTLLSMAAIVGAFTFWILQARPGAFAAAAAQSRGRTAEEVAGIEKGWRTDVSSRQLAVARIAWILFLISNLALIVNEASVADGVSFVGAVGAPVAQVATETQYGQFWLVRMALGLALGALLFEREALGKRLSLDSLDRVALVVGGGLLLSTSLTSHSAAIGSLTPLGVVNDWLHLAAASVWVGGLLQLAALVRPADRRAGLTETANTLGTLVPRFAVVAGSCLALLGVTGLVEALIHVGSFDKLTNTGYGQALLVKILLILPLLAIAAINHFVIRPVFQQGRDRPSATTFARVRDTTTLFRSTVWLEVLLAVGVIAAVGVMTSLSPSQQIAASGAGPLTLNATAGDLSLSFTVTPGLPGPNRYVVQVRDSSGQLVTDVQQVTLRFTYLDSNLGVAEAVLTPNGRGRFEGQSSDLAVAGRWQTEVTVRRPGRDDVGADFGFVVTSDGAQSLQGASLQLGWRFYIGLLIVVAGILSIARGGWLRHRDVRRAAAVALCGVFLGGIGGDLAFRDVQQARAQAAATMQALAHPMTPQSIANGAIVFRQNCAVCHGVDARGDGPLATSLSPPPSNLIVHVPMHPDTDLEGWIANGFPGSAMPAFKDKLTEQQRWDVLNYLKSEVSAATAAGAGRPSVPTPSPPSRRVLR